MNLKYNRKNYKSNLVEFNEKNIFVIIIFFYFFK